MKLSVHMGVYPKTANPGEVAHEAEIRGFDAVFFPEHTHLPLETNEFPYSEVAHRLNHTPHYYNVFVSMAWAASATKRIKIGTSVGLPAQYHPMILAKMLASVDAMSDGRVVYGFGYGWNEQEMRDHGVDPKRRRATVRETMLAVQALWTQDNPSFSGEFVNFPPCRFGPKPPDLSRIRRLLGAKASDKTFDHVIEYCDGWVPPQRGDVRVMVEDIARLRARAAESGRDPRSVQVDIIASEPSVATFAALAEAGVERVILNLPFVGLDEMKRCLDAYAEEYFPSGVVTPVF